MNSCSKCRSGFPEYYGADGNPLCKRCFSSAEIAVQEVRGVESAAGLEVTGDVRGLPTRLRGAGIAGMLFGTGLAAFGMLILSWRVVLGGVLAALSGAAAFRQSFRYGGR